MAKKRKNTTPAAPVGYYDETRIEWVQNEPNVYIATNLDEPDQAMVAHIMLPKVPVRRWMFRASDGTLIERKISEIGDAGIIVNEFNAQQLAIKWLNERREINAVQQPNTEEQFIYSFNGDVQKLPNPNYNPVISTGEPPRTMDNLPTDVDGLKVIDNRHDPAIVDGITHREPPPAPPAESDVHSFFPRTVDAFDKVIPADDVAAAQVVPNPAALEPAPDESHDEQIEVTPKRGRKR